MERGEQNVVELVNQWATYSEAHADADLAGFCLHYLTEVSGQFTLRDQNPARDSDGLLEDKWVESLTGKANRSLVEIQPEARLGALVGRLSKYAYFYSKKAMQPLGFKSIDDPVYLLVLLQMGTPKKSELIYEMLSEFASGIDIVNRLVGLGYIEEFPDEQDRRSKRLRLTGKGMEVIQNCLPEMSRVASVAFGTLSDGEKAILIQLLDRLDRYHADHYRLNRNEDFEEVYARMVKP